MVGVIGCIRVRLVRTKLNRDLNLTPHFSYVFVVLLTRLLYEQLTLVLLLVTTALLKWNVKQSICGLKIKCLLNYQMIKETGRICIEDASINHKLFEEYTYGCAGEGRMKRIIVGIALALLLIGMLTLVKIHSAKAGGWTGGTITINADGSTNPSDAPIQSADNITYRLTEDVFILSSFSEGIQVSKNNVILDGQGHKVRGSGASTHVGVRLGAQNTTLINTNVENTLFGISAYSIPTEISNNNITEIWRDGIVTSGSITIRGNTIRGAPGDAYGIQQIGGSDCLVEGNNISGFWYGIMLTYAASNNTIQGNYLWGNTVGFGTRESGSCYNVIRKNTVIGNYYGIDLYNNANYNVVTENNVTSNWPTPTRGEGIDCRESDYNLIWKNEIRANFVGIMLQNSQNNSMVENLIQENGGGIYLAYSSDNLAYHNSFINNTRQVADTSWEYPGTPTSINVWDDGYPSGGNYWSDYGGVDMCSGPCQNETGSDGIGDTPYVIDQLNRDNYPLWTPFQQKFQLTVLSSPVVGITFTLNGTSQTTPFAAMLGEGYYTIEMPQTHNGYVWSHWLEDGDTNLSKTVTMNTNITLTAVFLPIPPPLSASISPLSASVNVGDSVTFTSTVSGGTPPYSYQWYLDNNPISGATSASWAFTPTTTGNYTIHLNVTDNLGNIAKSNDAVVTVAAQLTASISPMSASVLVGQSVAFTSTVSGGYTPYTYQWYLNGNPVSGATSASWTFTPTASGIYYVHLKVTDAKANTAQSDAARITFPPPPPVGGYSFSIQVQTKAEPVLPYIALIATLTAVFTKLRPKTKRKR